MLQRYLFIPAGHRDNLGAVLGRKYQGYRKAAVIKSRYAHACAQLPAVNHKCIGIYGLGQVFVFVHYFVHVKAVKAYKPVGLIQSVGY